MDTGHFSGLRGVHAAVDCVPKWLTGLSARFTVCLHPRKENAKVKRMKRFCMYLQLLRHENITLAGPWYKNYTPLSLKFKSFVKQVRGDGDQPEWQTSLRGDLRPLWTLKELGCATEGRGDVKLGPVWRAATALCSGAALLPCASINHCHGQWYTDTQQKAGDPVLRLGSAECWSAPSRPCSRGRTTLQRAPKCPHCMAASPASSDQATALYW